MRTIGAVMTADHNPPIAVPSSKRARSGKWRLLLVVALLMIALGTVALRLRGRGYLSRVLHAIAPSHYPLLAHPNVTDSRPAPGEVGVMPNSMIVADVNLINPGQVVDGKTLKGGVLLYRADGSLVDVTVNTSGMGDVIVCKPNEPLALDARYTFQVLPAVKDTGGASFKPYRMQFHTAASVKEQPFPASFAKATLENAQGQSFTGVTIGPDHRLYATTLDGAIYRFAIEQDGSLGPPQVIDTITRANGGRRTVIGLCFDPAATADHLVAWVSHSEYAFGNAKDWTSKISRLSGADLEQYQDYVIHLPRSKQDHMTDLLRFGPDGAIYFGQASNSAMGRPDSQWGQRGEHLLTAAILRFDPRAVVNPPLDVQTDNGGAYDPFAPGAPLTLYATGARNAFDVLWHSNGHFYATVNGSAKGGCTPGTPADLAAVPRRIDSESRGAYSGPVVPELTDVATQDDFLIDIARGGYYGHPNPSRGEYVLNGGNPDSAANPLAVKEYPLGIPPDRNFRGIAFDFGKDLAPVGLIEYHAPAASPVAILDHALLVCRYSGGDVMVLIPGPDGKIAKGITDIDGLTGLINPLGIVEDDASGDLYVSELQARRITLLRPLAAVSQHTFRQSAPSTTPTGLTTTQECMPPSTRPAH